MDFLNQACEKVREIDMAELGQEKGKDVEEESWANVVPLTTDKSCTITELEANDESCATSPANKIIGNPRICQTKGRKSDKDKATEGNSTEGNSRFKSGIESKKKARICKTCKLVGHDTRNCPKKKEEQRLAAASGKGISHCM
ncbi:hypothetical protein MKW94_016292 [Papaver nudicaule]|uniref:CCHC-type domain-containing protein n=1 Tax=Papaver nudicaule TaxID=74823 RepID=A0AA42B3N6_PAPNU|nr:hypothetical protein [Papaver nudicaule]